MIRILLRLTVLIFLIGVSSSCERKAMWKIELVNRTTFKEIPSASGVERWNDRYFIVGDNSPWLFETDTLGNTLVKHRIGEASEPDLIPKAQKHDFEAMCTLDWQGEQVLFLFGSGSKWPYRNKGVAFSVTQQKLIETYDLSALYEALMDKANIQQDELNIEAATALNGKLYLFNRGENKVIILKEKEFIDFLKDADVLPKFKVYSLDLPKIDGIPAGFSGATSDEMNGKILFTASVENTSDWVQDGAVLGSFVGIFDPEKLHQHYSPHVAIIEDRSDLIKVKVESITLDDIQDKLYQCALITDSDGGESELLKISFYKGEGELTIDN